MKSEEPNDVCFFLFILSFFLTTFLLQSVAPMEVDETDDDVIREMDRFSCQYDISGLNNVCVRWLFVYCVYDIPRCGRVRVN